jgi:hypothetical protein
MRGLFADVCISSFELGADLVSKELQYGNNSVLSWRESNSTARHDSKITLKVHLSVTTTIKCRRGSSHLRPTSASLSHRPIVGANE